MPGFVTRYKVSNGTAAVGSGDAFARTSGTSAVNDGALTSPIGRFANGVPKISYMARYDVEAPSSGPAFDLGNGRLTGVRWLWEVSQDAVVNGDFGLFNFGLLDVTQAASLWRDPANCFSNAAYALQADLPFPSDEADVIQSGRLFNDAFFNEGPPFFTWVYSEAATVVGSTWTLGEDGDPIDYDASDAISQLTEYLATPAAQQYKVVGVVMDAYDLPPFTNILENFWLYQSPNTGHTFDGMEMELEWTLPTQITAKGFAQERGVAKGFAQERVEAKDIAQERGVAKGFAQERVEAKDIAQERVTAPGSYGNSGEE